MWVPRSPRSREFGVDRGNVAELRRRHDRPRTIGAWTARPESGWDRRIAAADPATLAAGCARSALLIAALGAAALALGGLRAASATTGATAIASRPTTVTRAPARGRRARRAPASATFATKNTTRVAGADRPEPAAARRAGRLPGEGRQRPDAVVLADAGDWRAALAGVGADGAADPRAAAARRRRRAAGRHAGGARRAAPARRAGAGASAGDPRRRPRPTRAAACDGSIAGADPFDARAAIDRVPRAIARQPSRAVVDRRRPTTRRTRCRPPPGRRSPATRSCSSRATRCRRRRARALRAHGRPRIYVLGPRERGLARGRARSSAQLGTVTRIAGADAATTAIAFARFSTGDVRLGHRRPRPRPRLRRSAAAARRRRPPRRCRRAGRYGPLLLTDDADGLPARGRRLPARHPARLPSDPVRGVYNHGWIDRRTSRPSRVAPRPRSTPCSRSPPSASREPDERSRAPRAQRARPRGHRRGRAPADGRLDAALRAAAAQPDRAADRAACPPTTRRALEGEREIARLDALGFDGEDARPPRRGGPARRCASVVSGPDGALTAGRRR